MPALLAQIWACGNAHWLVQAADARFPRGRPLSARSAANRTAAAFAGGSCCSTLLWAVLRSLNIDRASRKRSAHALQRRQAATGRLPADCAAFQVNNSANCAHRRPHKTLRACCRTPPPPPLPPPPALTLLTSHHLSHLAAWRISLRQWMTAVPQARCWKPRHSVAEMTAAACSQTATHSSPSSAQQMDRCVLAHWLHPASCSPPQPALQGCCQPGPSRSW